MFGAVSPWLCRDMAKGGEEENTATGELLRLQLKSRLYPTLEGASLKALFMNPCRLLGEEIVYGHK